MATTVPAGFFGQVFDFSLSVCTHKDALAGVRCESSGLLCSLAQLGRVCIIVAHKDVVDGGGPAHVISKPNDFLVALAAAETVARGWSKRRLSHALLQLAASHKDRVARPVLVFQVSLILDDMGFDITPVVSSRAVKVLLGLRFAHCLLF